MDGAATEPPLGRCRDAQDDLAIQRCRVTQPDRQEPSARGLATRGERAHIALAGQLAERDERLDLAAGPPIELAERAVEDRLGGDGDDEDVRGNVPRLVGGDTKLHGYGSLRKRAAERHRGTARLGWAGVSGSV